jgi:hypothetical protein
MNLNHHKQRLNISRCGRRVRPKTFHLLATSYSYIPASNIDLTQWVEDLDVYTYPPIATITSFFCHPHWNALIHQKKWQPQMDLAKSHQKSDWDGIFLILWPPTNPLPWPHYRKENTYLYIVQFNQKMMARCTNSLIFKVLQTWDILFTYQLWESVKDTWSIGGR